MKDKITINAQSSIRIETDKIIYFDPFKIEDDLHDADLILITHDHFDHFDITSIEKIMKAETKIVAPNSIISKLIDSGIDRQKIINVRPNKTYDILGFKLDVLPSYNIDKKFHPKENEYVGYIIELNGERIYVSGDTDATEESMHVKCDIALVPIGGTYTMDYKEASSLINTIKPKTVIPTHYNSIVGSLEDGEEFKKLLHEDIECILMIK